jgi:hypothetical protein
VSVSAPPTAKRSSIVTKSAVPTRRATAVRPATAGARNIPAPSRNEPAPTERAILNVGNKERRLEVDRRTKWGIEELRHDYVEKLTDLLRQTMSAEMSENMISADFKKN